MSDPHHSESRVDPGSGSPDDVSSSRRFPFWRTLLTVAVLAMAWSSVSEYYSSDLIIEPISVPVGLERAGISSAVLTHELAEQLLALISSTRVTQAGPGGAAGSAVRHSSINTGAAGESLDIEIPETGLSLKTITQFVQHFLPKRDVPVLHGDAVLLGDKVLLTLSVTNKDEQPTPAETWTDTFPLLSVAEEMRNGALAMLPFVDPLSAAMRAYYFEPPSEGTKAALEILETQSHSQSKLRARSALVLWGGICRDLRRYSQAMSRFDEAERVAGLDENILLGRASVYSAIGNSTEALRLTNRAVNTNRTSATLVAAGDAIKGINDLKAKSYYQAALRKDPHFSPAYIGLSNVAIDDGDWSSAKAFARLATEDVGSSEEQAAGWTQLGKIALQRGQFEHAVRNYVHAETLLEGNVEDLEGLARAFHEEGLNELADEAFTLALQNTDDRASVQKDWADMVHYFYGDLPKADELYNKAIAEDTDHTFDFGHGALGILKLELGQQEAAQSEFQTAVAISPFPARIELDWGDALSMAGEFPDAQIHYERAVQLAPQLCEAQIARARLAYRSAVDRINPQAASLVDSLGKDRNPYENADAQYYQAIQSCAHPEQAYSDWEYAVSGSQRSDVDEKYVAIDRNLLLRNPGAIDPTVRLAENLGQPEVVATGLKKVSYPAGLMASWGQRSLEDRRYFEAEQRAAMALNLDSENTVAKDVLILDSVARGTMTHTELKEKMPELLGGDNTASLGDVLARKGWTEEAQRIYANGFRLNNGDSDSNRKLGVLLCKRSETEIGTRHLLWAAEPNMLWGYISQDSRQIYETLLSTPQVSYVPATIQDSLRSELARVSAQVSPRLMQDLDAIAADAKGDVSVACDSPDVSLDCNLYPRAQAPLGSAFRIPLAVTVLLKVENGSLAIDQNAGLRNEKLGDLMQRAVSLDDKYAQNILLQIVGGPNVVGNYLQQLGLSGFHFDDDRLPYLRGMIGPQKWWEPWSAVQLLRTLNERPVLSLAHTQLLQGWMTSSALSDRGIASQLPSQARLGHCLGLQPEKDGIAPETDDLGFFATPDGHTMAMAIFITGSTASQETRQQVIGRIAKAVYDQMLSLTQKK